MANRLLDLLDGNNEAKQDIKAHLDSHEELINTIKKYIPDYTDDELNDDMNNIKKSRQVIQEGELNLDQLEQVAGGAPEGGIAFFELLFGWL